MKFDEWKETYDPQKLTSYEEELEAAWEAGYRQGQLDLAIEVGNQLTEDNSFNRKWDDMK